MLGYGIAGLSMLALLGQQAIQSKPLSPVTVQEATPAEQPAQGAPARPKSTQRQQAPAAEAPVMPSASEYHWQNVSPERDAVQISDSAEKVQPLDSKQPAMVQEEIPLPVAAPPPSVPVNEVPAAPAPPPAASRQASGKRVAAFWMMVPGL